MKLIFEKLTVGSDEGFTFKEIRSRSFSCPWHFHAELELILTVQCPGYRMVGDSLTAIEPGDLVLLGSNVPHLWHRDEHKGIAHMLIIQFEPSFLGESFWRLAATRGLRQLIRRASAGLLFEGKTRDRISHLMREMGSASAMQRVISLLSILETLSASSECQAIASPGYTPQLKPFDQEQMDRVFQFINQRFDQEIRLEEAAQLAGLSEGAFSRFFHRHSGRTFPEFVNQLRVGRACRLLAESEMKITDVALASGFTNLSNFNRKFLALKKITPREYRRQLSDS